MTRLLTTRLASSIGGWLTGMLSQTRNGLGMQDNGDMIKDKGACQKLAQQNGPLVDEGIKELQQADQFASCATMMPCRT